MTVLLVTCPLKRGRGHSSERVKLIEESARRPAVSPAPMIPFAIRPQSE